MNLCITNGLAEYLTTIQLCKLESCSKKLYNTIKLNSIWLQKCKLNFEDMENIKYNISTSRILAKWYNIKKLYMILVNR